MGKTSSNHNVHLEDFVKETFNYLQTSVPEGFGTQEPFRAGYFLSVISTGRKEKLPYSVCGIYLSYSYHPEIEALYTKNDTFQLYI